MSNGTARVDLGPLQADADRIVDGLQRADVIRRIWDRDHTVWKPEPTEIANRLGWLDSPAGVVPQLEAVGRLVSEARRDGYTHALLLGMGGSSLAPEVFRQVFGVAPGHPDLAVLDSTHPGAVLAHDRRLDLSRSLFLPATKSGGTVETMSFLKFYYNRVVTSRGQDRAGAHFVAITDPGSGLEDTARALGCRRVFLNDPDIGGRYSALSLFGLVPAALLGIDAARLLERAREAELDRRRAADNPGAHLGAAMAAAAAAGRDKLTLVLSPAIAPLGAWVEQLVAESTGKEGRGILPVDAEPLGPPEVYGDDRLFVYLRLRGDDAHDRAMESLARAGHPVYRAGLSDTYDLGAEFFRWEMATAVVGHCLGINPFDQPDVEAAKVLARESVAAYLERGRLPAAPPRFTEAGIAAFPCGSASSLAGALEELLAGVAGGPGRPYLAVQAYLQPEPTATALLQELRRRWRDRLRLATTLGYGPRFLHSTGQLHKGDAGRGRFLQLTADPVEDAPIPDAAGADASRLSFGVLLAAQAAGDRQALIERGRAVLRLHLGRDVEAGLRHLLRLVA